MPSEEDLKRTMQAKTDEELYLLLRVHSQDYTLQALTVASEEFGRRHLDEPTISRIMASAEKALEDGNGKLGRPEGKPTNDANETATGRGWRFFIAAARGLGGLLLLCFVGYICYGRLDSIGWITHRHDTPVWIKGDWMVGEYRNCGMLTTTFTMKPGVQAELPRLFCSDRGEGLAEFEREFRNISAPQDFAAVRNALWYEGDWGGLESKFHVLPVRYQGRINRPDKALIEWRCQRLTASLECKALN